MSLPFTAHYRAVIVGGGTGGISVAARLAKKIKATIIAIIEPSEKHYYQPLWTLVGGGKFPKQIRDIPNGLIERAL